MAAFDGWLQGEDVEWSQNFIYEGGICGGATPTKETGEWMQASLQIAPTGIAVRGVKP